MKKIKICAPVIGKNLKEFLNNLDQVQEISDMVELRVDEIKNLNESDLDLIRKKTVKEAIFTSRKKEMILKGLDLEFDFIDMRLSLIKNLNISELDKSKIILSFHDFEKTPNIIDLTSTVNVMRKWKVEVIKIATMINKIQDIKNIFLILFNKKKNEKMIVIGMGEKGKITRVVGPLLGSFLTFASTKFGATAPGQIDINKLKNIYKLIT